MEPRLVLCLTNSNLATCSLGAIQVLATGVMTWLLDRAGRRMLLVISTSGMTLCLAISVYFSSRFCTIPKGFWLVLSFPQILLSLVFFQDKISKDSDLYYILTMISLVAILAFVITFSFGMGAIPWLMMSEILPVSIKSLGGSVATLANWLTSFAITMTMNLMLTWSVGGTFLSYMVVSAFTLGAGDERKNTRGDSIFVSLSIEHQLQRSFEFSLGRQGSVSVEQEILGILLNAHEFS